ncbi:hypothetical protein L1987_64115 [Smallanthus sonchifolius]|uniref:Uncharacterized protein n=1 Tax=Smallanthus sonchifolius TaxID=185202 RepID=A0ACB9CFG6_9ASTR|nr:hypothetical protein L1987_64115 [Smallanthus sonchifolius]
MLSSHCPCYLNPLPFKFAIFTILTKINSRLKIYQWSKDLSPFYICVPPVSLIIIRVYCYRAYRLLAR